MTTPLKWVLLLYQAPPEPMYLRAKILRRIKGLGAIPIKKSAYILPANDDTVEDFQWLAKEIAADGGEAWILHGNLLAGVSDAQLIQQFQQARGLDYEALAKSVREEESVSLARQAKRLEEIVKIDFFGAPGRKEVVEMIEELRKPAAEPKAGGVAGFARNGVWVTRQGVKVDRMISAWLIRRYLDPGARFRFVDPSTYEHREGEIRFDMFEGEFTHLDDRCTFEVLLSASGLAGSVPGLQAIAEVVHDLDIKDEKYQRAETAGVAATLAGIARRYPDDAARIDKAAEFLDNLLAGN